MSGSEPSPAIDAGPLGALSHETVRGLLEDAADGVFLAVERDESLVFTWVNDRGARLFRRTPEEIIGCRLQDIMWDPDELTRRPYDRGRLVRGETARGVRAVRGGDGSRLVMEVTTRRLESGLHITFTRDVTERVEAQERLIRSESSFRALIERSPDGIAVHQRGRFVYANSAIARILGLTSPADLVGRVASEVVAPEDRAAAAERVEAMLEGQPSVPFAEQRLLRADGKTMTASVAALRVEFGGEASIAVIARDLGEQRRMMAQLAQAERLASIGVLAAGVGHEINNPLTYVILRLGAAAALERRMRAALAEFGGAFGGQAGESPTGEAMGMERLDELAGHLTSAQDGADRIRQIVSDLRMFSRATDDAIVPVDVRAPLERALAMASHELKHRARITKDLAPTPAVMANEGRLAQVFLNLLLNAAQAIPEGAPEKHSIDLSTRADGAWVEARVRDSGGGIDEDVLPRLFEPFFTTKPAGAGSGLGLAVSHGIVVGLGGTIEVTSEAGVGSTFCVRLPATTEAPTIAPPSPQRTTSAAAVARILVVDDELSLARAVAMLLERHGRVVVESSAEHAQDRLARGEDFDVVLCDVVMPVMSGFDLFRWIEAQRPDLAARVVFMSGGRLSEAERVHSEEHPERWLSKPFDAERLESTVQRVLHRREPPRGR